MKFVLNWQGREQPEAEWDQGKWFKSYDESARATLLACVIVAEFKASGN